MARKGHSEEQILSALRRVEAGQKVGDVCRECGVSQQAFYSWKRRYRDLRVVVEDRLRHSVEAGNRLLFRGASG